VLDATYDIDAKKAIQRIYKLLDKFDELDQARARLAAELSDEIERKGPKSVKIKKIKQDMEKVDSERKLTQQELDKLRDLPGKATAKG
jgi:chromosome segregation ATPase